MVGNGYSQPITSLKTPQAPPNFTIIAANKIISVNSAHILIDSQRDSQQIEQKSHPSTLLDTETYSFPRHTQWTYIGMALHLGTFNHPNCVAFADEIHHRWQLHRNSNKKLYLLFTSISRTKAWKKKKRYTTHTHTIHMYIRKTI